MYSLFELYLSKTGMTQLKNISQDEKELINFEAVSIKYYVSVCITALVNAHSKRIFSAQYCIVICRLSGYIVFFHITLQRHDFGKKDIEYKVF
jgi:hypothetical protein